MSEGGAPCSRLEALSRCEAGQSRCWWRALTCDLHLSQPSKGTLVAETHGKDREGSVVPVDDELAALYSGDELDDWQCRESWRCLREGR